MGQIFCSCCGRKVMLNGINYDVIRDIGEGAYSFVQLVGKGTKQYALKRVLIQVPETHEMVRREVNAHKLIQHPNVIPLLSHEIVEKEGAREGRLLFPYHKYGSVQEMIEVATITRTPLDEKDILSIFRSLCDAVNAFHTHDPPYAHRDVKPHNLLLTEDHKVILLDLGSTMEGRVHIRSRQEALELQDQCRQDCTAAFRAPELFDVLSDSFITEKSDIWSLGCTLHALGFGDSPCDGTGLSSLSPKILVDPDRYSQSFHTLVFSMMNVCPSERPTASDIIRTIDNILEGVPQRARSSKTNAENTEEIGMMNKCFED